MRSVKNVARTKHNKLAIVLGIVVVLIFAFAIRVYDLSKIPPEVFCDEASVGVNARSIMTTGRDEHGLVVPIFFSAMGDYKNPLPIYLSAPLITAAGNNAFSLRLPEVLFGCLGVLFLFLLLKRIFGLFVAFSGAIFMAVLPMHIFFTRLGFDGLILLPTMVLASLYVSSFIKKNILFVYIAATCWGLTMFAYSMGRVFVPLMIVGLALFNIRFILRKWKHFLFAGLVLAVFLAPFAYQYFYSPVKQWNEKTLLFENTTVAEKLTKFGNNYILQLSPTFLVDGEKKVERHGTREVGPTYLFGYIIAVIGLVYSLFRRGAKRYVPLLCLILFPIPSALTSAALSTRATLAVIPLSIYFAYGLYFICRVIAVVFKRMPRASFYLRLLAVGLVFSCLLSSFVYFYTIYTKVYPIYSGNTWYGWSAGFSNVLAYYSSVYSNYDEFFISPDGIGGPTNSPDPIVAFLYPNYKNFRVGNPDPDKVDNTKRQLFALDAKRKLPGAHKVTSIFNSTGLLTYYVWEMNK